MLCKSLFPGVALPCCSMALHGLASLLRRALTYFGEAAVRGDPSGSNVQYLDFSAMSDLVQAAVNGWGSAEPPAKAEIIRCDLCYGATACTVPWQVRRRWWCSDDLQSEQGGSPLEYTHRAAEPTPACPAAAGW